jgi:hypothetical protein
VFELVPSPEPVPPKALHPVGLIELFMLAAEPLRLPFVIGTDTPEQRHCEKLIFTN